MSGIKEGLEKEIFDIHLLRRNNGGCANRIVLTNDSGFYCSALNDFAIDEVFADHDIGKPGLNRY